MHLCEEKKNGCKDFFDAPLLFKVLVFKSVSAFIVPAVLYIFVISLYLSAQRLFAFLGFTNVCLLLLKQTTNKQTNTYTLHIEF